jgi:hypothetical protein
LAKERGPFISEYLKFYYQIDVFLCKFIVNLKLNGNFGCCPEKDILNILGFENKLVFTDLTSFMHDP